MELAFAKDINDSRFIPYIQLHEFEALILAEPGKLAMRFPEHEQKVQELSITCNRFSSPELINDGVTTAPSKRISQFIPDYEGSKVSIAPLMVKKIGLEKIREKCAHFDRWITQLENLTQIPT